MNPVKEDKYILVDASFIGLRQRKYSIKLTMCGLRPKVAQAKFRKTREKRKKNAEKKDK